MSRRILIAGNWKMNKTSAEGAKLVKEIKAALPCGGSTACCKGPEVLVCPPFLAIAAVAAETKGSCVALGAQNVHWAANGAYTGEVSAAMLQDAGCTHAIIGHSERRQYFGETLAEREAGVTNGVVGRQVQKGLDGLSAADMEKVVVAYEPVWAIGTGKVATDEQAQEVHAFIRAELAKRFGAETAETVRILYGGSMKPGNAAGLLAQKDIDGGLIGGAALNAADFVEIINAANQD